MVVQTTDFGNLNDLSEIHRLKQPWLRGVLLQR